MKTKRYCFGMITTFVMAATILFVDKAAGAVCNQVLIDPKDCRSWSDWVNITRACGPVETCVRVDTGPTKVNKGKPIVRVANSVTVSNCNQSETLNVSKTLSFSYNTPTVSYSICSDLSAGDKETIQAGLQASAGVNLPGSSIEDSMTVDGYTVDGYHKRTFSVIVTEYVGQKWQYEHKWTYSVQYVNATYWLSAGYGGAAEIPCDGWTSTKTNRSQATVQFPLSASSSEIKDGPNVLCGGP